MPIDIPKPIEPQQAPLEQLQPQAASAITVDFQQTHVHVFGDLPIGEARVRAALERSSNLSDAVRGIGAECYLAGYPAAMLYYAATGNDVYVLVRRGRIDKVEAPAPYDKYFAPLADGKVLTDSRLEPARTLASVQADRAALRGQIVLKPDGADTATLSIDPAAPGPKATDLRLDIGNPGNRFFGRDLIDGSVRHSDAWGDEFRFTSIAGFRGLGLQRDTNGPFHEQDASLTRVTSLGIGDIDIRFSDFRVPLNDNRAVFDTTNNIMLVGGASWLVPVYVDFEHRFTAQVRVDYTRRTSEFRVNAPNVGPILLNTPRQDAIGSTETLNSGDQLLDEKYASLEASLAYSQSIHTGSATYGVDASATVRRGLGARDSSAGSGNLDYLVERPALQLSMQPGEHLYLLLSAQAQFSGLTMPEEQQWVLGGIGNLYAWLPGVALGDKGWLGRAEAQWRHLEFEPFKLTPRAFVEWGQARYNNGAILAINNGFSLGSTTSTTPSASRIGTQQSLADAGGALDIEVFSWLEGSFSAAASLYHHGVTASTRDIAQANYYFRVSAKY